MEIYKNEKRKKDKSDFSTIDKVLDPKTLNIIDNLKSRNKLFDMGCAFSSGKEANVYTAKCSTTLISKFIEPDSQKIEEIVPVILKIYKTSTMLFKDRIRYIADEKRFNNFCTSNSRKLVKIWAEKEIRNLKRMAKFGILCPKPLYMKRSILIMTMIGDEYPAPRLKDAVINDYKKVYFECIDIMKNLYQKAKLVHADFSEYNLVFHNQIVYVIDVGQSVETGHENANNFLINDICNINDFFRKKEIIVVNEIDIFEDITGLKVPEYLRGMKLNKDIFIPTRLNEVVNAEDIGLFLEGNEQIPSWLKKNPAHSAESKHIFENISTNFSEGDSGFDESENDFYEYGQDGEYSDYENEYDIDESAYNDYEDEYEEEGIVPNCINSSMNNNAFEPVKSAMKENESEEQKIAIKYENDVNIESSETDGSYLISSDSMTENAFPSESNNPWNMKDETPSIENINIYVRKLRISNPNITLEEEKEYNKERKRLIKEMNKERRSLRVIKEQDPKIKKLEKKSKNKNKKK